jgi:hypothetical protein
MEHLAPAHFCDWDSWHYVDRNGSLDNFGIISLNDNLYDGVESTATKIVDSLGVVTTTETRNYGDFLSHVKNGQSNVAQRAATPWPAAFKGGRLSWHP